MSKAYDRSIRNNYEGLTPTDLMRHTPAVLASHAWNPSEGGGVSTRYSHISSTNVIDELTKAGFSLVAAMQSNSRIAGKSDYTKHQLVFRDRKYLGVQGLEGVPEVLIINDHAAASAYKVMAAYFRLICQNGLVLVDTASDILRVIHTGTVVEEVLAATFQIASQMESKLAAIAEMKQIVLHPAERLQLAKQVAFARYGEPQVVEGSLVPYKDQIHPSELLRPRKEGDRELDLWHTYNVAQYNATNGGVRIKGYDKARKVTALDTSLRINVAAWQAAQELRELHTIG